MFKKVDIIFEDNSYSCIIKADKEEESITFIIYQNNLINFEGKITLKEIYTKISIFQGITIEQLFNVLF